MRAHVIVMGVLSIGGCGGDPTPSPSGSSSPAGAGAGDGRKPCEYMARSDAETAVGMPLPGTSENIVLRMCDYTTAEFYGASLVVGDWEDIARAANAKPDHPAVAVTDVGDEALHLGPNVYVRKGTRGFLVYISGPKVDGLPDHGLDRTKILARTIYARL